MPVRGVNHVNIRTTDLARSVEFYVGVFDFVHRTGPLVMGHPVNWLVDGADNPIIHLRQREPDGASTGPIDHVALNCEGKADILARLDARGVKYAVVEHLTPGVTQVVLRDPHGVTLELNFPGE